MSIDFEALLFDVCHRTFGDTIYFVSPFTGMPVSLVGIDKTDGVMLMDAEIGVPTLKPAIAIMARELYKLEIRPEMMAGVIVEVNGKDWKITDVRPGSNPTGEAKDEVYFALEQPVEMRSPTLGFSELRADVKDVEVKKP